MTTPLRKRVISASTERVITPDRFYDRQESRHKAPSRSLTRSKQTVNQKSRCSLLNCTGQKFALAYFFRYRSKPYNIKPAAASIMAQSSAGCSLLSVSQFCQLMSPPVTGMITSSALVAGTPSGTAVAPMSGICSPPNAAKPYGVIVGGGVFVINPPVTGTPAVGEGVCVSFGATMMTGIVSTGVCVITTVIMIGAGVGGTGVAVMMIGVGLAGTGVAVMMIGVGLAGTGVAVMMIGVGVAGTGVAVMTIDVCEGAPIVIVGGGVIDGVSDGITVMTTGVCVGVTGVGDGVGVNEGVTVMTIGVWVGVMGVLDGVSVGAVCVGVGVSDGMNSVSVGVAVGAV